MEALETARQDAADAKASRQRVFHSAAMVAGLTSLAKVAAAIKVAVTARYFGTGDDLDAFLIAFVLPSFFVDTIAGSFTPSLVPELMRLQNGGAARLAQAGLTLVLGAMLPVTILLILGSQWMLPLLGSSFSPQKLDTTYWLLIGMLVWLPLGAVSAAWRAVLNAHNRVALGAAVALTSPVITMIALYFGAAKWGAAVLSASVALGAFAESAILAIAVHRLGYSLKPAWPGWTPEVLAIRRQYAPLLAAAVITCGCGLVDQAVAASLGSGSVSAFSFGTKLGAVVIAICGTGMATAVLPEFSRLTVQKRWPALRRSVWTHARTALFAMIPLSALLIVGSASLVRWMFLRGEFTAADAVTVAGIQRYSLMQVPITVALAIVQRVVTALSVPRLILHASIASMVINIGGDFILPPLMGVNGIPAATVLAQLVFLAALIALLYWKEPRLFRDAEGS